MKEDKELVMCFDAYNGLMYWEREIPGAYRVHMAVDCSNIACTEDNLFVATGSKCLRLDAATGHTKATYKVPPPADGSERQWAYVAVVDSLLFGSTYSGPEYSDSVFAVDIETGQRLWLHQGQKIRNNTIAVSDGRIFFADDRATDEQRREAVEERIRWLKAEKGSVETTVEQELAEANVRVVTALDATTGKRIWERPVDLTGCGDEKSAWSQDNPNKTDYTLSAICKNDVLLFCAALCNGHYWGQFLSGEFAGRTAIALSAQDGSLLWSKAIGYRIRPLVIGDTIYAEPWAFDLHTGEQKMRSHPLTGQPTPWEFERPGHHCGTISGSPNALFFRSWFTAYYDLASDHGTSYFSGHRPGCWINQIPANGLVIEPEASSGCTCLYSLQCTVVFEPRGPDKVWGVFASRGTMTPVNHLAVNLGAPGDRRDRHGTLWLSYPRPPGRLRLDLKLEVTTLPECDYFNHAAEDYQIAGTDRPWLYASGCSGLTSLNIPLVGEEHLYTVRLGFADTENSQPGQRVFDIKLQDKLVEKDFDIMRETNGANQAVVKEFKGIEVHDDLRVELVPKVNNPSKAQVPILNSVEIVRESESNIGQKEQATTMKSWPLPFTWKFAIDPDDVGVQEKWFSTSFNDENWAEVRSDQGNGWESQGFPDYTGVGWYRQRLQIPAELTEADRKYLYLCFGAVDEDAWIYINGRLACEHTCASTGLTVDEIWYTPVVFDARPYLNPGQVNTIAVKVYNRYAMGGIYLPVYLVAADRTLYKALVTSLVKPEMYGR